MSGTRSNLCGLKLMRFIAPAVQLQLNIIINGCTVCLYTVAEGLCWSCCLSGAQLQPLSDFWRLGTWKAGLSHGHLKAQVPAIEPKRVLWCSHKGSIADAQSKPLKWFLSLSLLLHWASCRDCLVCGFNWNLFFLFQNPLYGYNINSQLKHVTILSGVTSPSCRVVPASSSKLWVVV